MHSIRICDSAESLGIIKIKRKKKWDDEGVASTVGTIMALLVFLTFLGMFTNQYIPIWMKENENNHMNDVVSQFSDLKMGVDILILSSDEGETASAPIYTPIKLHADGVPVFASATAGRLSFTAESDGGYPSFAVSFPYYVLDESSNPVYYDFNSSKGGKAGGNLEFYGPNRYYVQQTLAYENGAIILNQTDGEVMLTGMSLRIVKYGDDLIVKMTQISFSGVNKTIGGYGTKGVSTTLEYSSYTKLRNSSTTGGILNITIISKFGTAWADYFTGILTDNTANITTSEWDVNTSSFQVGEETYHYVWVTIQGVNLLEHTKAMVDASIADISI